MQSSTHEEILADYFAGNYITLDDAVDILNGDKDQNLTDVFIHYYLVRTKYDFDHDRAIEYLFSFYEGLRSIKEKGLLNDNDCQQKLTNYYIMLRRGV